MGDRDGPGPTQGPLRPYLRFFFLRDLADVDDSGSMAEYGWPFDTLGVDVTLPGAS